MILKSEKADSILQSWKKWPQRCDWVIVIIAMLTLLGASIGLMNIMLVSVTERTNWGKALGATSNKYPYSVSDWSHRHLSLLGGLVGILLGIGMGYGITLIIKGKFFFFIPGHDHVGYNRFVSLQA